MKKAIIICLTFTLAILAGVKVKAQNTDCQVPMMVYMSDQEDFPNSAAKLLYNKLNRVIVDNGVSAEGYCQFILSSNFTVINKTILAGPPRSFVYEFEVNLFIGDYLEKKIYTSTTLNLKGVGQNDTKAYIDAIKKIKPGSPELQKLVADGKTKVIAYYDANYASIIKKAQSQANQKNFEEAMFGLMSIPSCCIGYDKALKAAEVVYQAYVDDLCVKNLGKAKMAWAAQQDADGAREAGEYLAYIYPDARCYPEAEKLYKEIKAKVREDWDFVLKMYDDAVSLEEQRIDAWREVGVAFGKNQQPNSTKVIWSR